MPSTPRSVNIDPDERGGWSSERPRRPGEPERPKRPADVSARCRVLVPTDRIRYSPGSLLLVVGPDDAMRDELCARLIEEKAALLSLTALRKLLAGKVAEGEIEAKARALREAVAKKRIAAGDSVVISTQGLDAAERDHWVRIAAEHRRPRHLMLVEFAAGALEPDQRAQLNALRKSLEAGELGQEGFYTAVRLSGRTLEERRRVVFAPVPAND